MAESQDTTLYRVLVNDEQQYSLWPLRREIPAGWADAGQQGPKQECLEFIERTWVDMRPLSLRQAMDRTASGGS